MKSGILHLVMKVKKHLFLTGPEHRVPDFLLKNELSSRLSEAGGFLSRAVEEGGETRLELLPAAAFGGVEGYEPLPYLWQGPRWRTDNQVFRHQAAQLLREASWYGFAVLDPLGGFELLIPQYRAALEDFLSSQLPIVAILLSPSEAENQRQKLGLGEKELLYLRQLRQALTDDPDSAILDFSRMTPKHGQEILRAWTREVLG